MRNRKILKTIKSFNVMEWLVFIKILENLSEEELRKYSLGTSQLSMLQNTNWYRMVLDLALRLSPYNAKDMIAIYDYQMVPKYLELISDYINYHENLEEYKQNLESSLYQMIAFLMDDQLRNISPIINSLGRLIALYDTQESLFKQELGLTPKQILLFYYIMSSIPNDTKPLDKDVIFQLLQQFDPNISNQSVINFLNKFSISIKDYRLKAKSFGITKDTITNRRLIMEYPIIKYNDSYITPSIFVLLESLSYKIFNKINTNENRRRVFGNIFEEYIRDMTKYFHTNNFYECKGLMKEDENKAEFYLKNNELSLVIEAKVLHIDDDIVSSENSEEIEKKFKNTFNKAFKQLNSCNNKLPNMYSIIVIHTHLPIINVFIESLIEENKKKYHWLDKMVLLTIVDYENIISLPFDEIIEKLKLLKDTSFNMIEGRENSYLQEKYTTYMESIKEEQLS